MTETTKTPHLREDVDRQTTSKPEMSPPFTLEHGWLPMVINLLNKVACFIRRISLSSGSTGKGARVQCPLSPVKIVHKRVVSKRRTYRFMFPGLPAPPPHKFLVPLLVYCKLLTSIHKFYLHYYLLSSDH